MPHIPAQVIIYEARSFNWIYSFLLQHYGHRTSIEVRSVKTMQTDPKLLTKEPEERLATKPGSDLAARAEDDPGIKAPNEDQEECDETVDKVSVAQSDNDSAITVSSKSIGEVADQNVGEKMGQNDQTSTETEHVVEQIPDYWKGRSDEDNSWEVPKNSSEYQKELKGFYIKQTEARSKNETATEKESENRAKVAQINSLGEAQSAQELRERQLEPERTGLDVTTPGARTGIQRCVVSSQARPSSVHTSDRDGRSQDRQRTVSPLGPQAQPTSDDTPTPGPNPLARTTLYGGRQHEGRPAPREREAPTPQRRIIRTTGISAMRDAASAWS